MAEGARLESVYTARYRGFESLPHRHLYRSPALAAGLRRFGEVKSSLKGEIPLGSSRAKRDSFGARDDSPKDEERNDK